MSNTKGRKALEGERADECERLEDCLYWLKNSMGTTKREVAAIDDFMAAMGPSALAALYRKVRA